MIASTRTLLRRLSRRRAASAGDSDASDEPTAAETRGLRLEHAPVDLAADDPLLDVFLQAEASVDIDALRLDSPGLRELRASGVKLAVPLVTQGELIGVLNLGARMSEQDYSSDDRRLLENLAAQAAPALRVGQLVREQQAQAARRQRLAQELEVARLIQQNFLPKVLPTLAGWRIAAYYRPAREVGGDFYDVIVLPDGRVGFVVGDVTDKGVPAALVMSATRAILRAFATRLLEPGAVLERVNEHLCPDMPAKMFVTCLYGVLDPASGLLRFANAGHDVPYVKTAEGVVELRARGMPLGLMPGMEYEEREAVLAPGDSVLLHSDGIVEAHAPDREMYGFPRLKDVVGQGAGGQALIDLVLSELALFVGPGAEQEDDITMLTLERADGLSPESAAAPDRRVLARLDLPSEPGSERQAIDGVERAVQPLGLPGLRLERLKTAVAEAVMNAIEHGNESVTECRIAVVVLMWPGRLAVQVTDQGTSGGLLREEPDLEAKLAGRQAPRGWGLFLIDRMVDETRAIRDARGHTLELVMHLEGASRDDG